MADNEDEIIVAKRVDGGNDASLGKITLLVVAFIVVVGGILYAAIAVSHASI